MWFLVSECGGRTGCYRSLRRSWDLRGRSVGEGADQLVDASGQAGQFGGRLLGGRGAFGGGAGRGGHAGDVLGDVAGAAGDLADVAAEFRRGGRLFLDRGGDGGLQFVDLVDDVGDLPDLLRHVCGGALDRGGLAGDVLGGLGRLLRQVLDFPGDNREALAGIACAGGFDGGVQREQIGLLGDHVDDLEDVADLRAGLIESGYRIGGGPRRGHRPGGDAGRGGRATGDFADRRGHLLGGRGHGGHVRRHLLGGCGYGAGLRGGFLGAAAQLGGHRGQLLRGARERGGGLSDGSHRLPHRGDGGRQGT